MKKTLLLVLSSILLVTTSLFGVDATNQSTDVLVNGKKVGYIAVLTPVEKVSKTEVKIKGFRNESYPQMVVRDMKLGELYVSFDEDKEKIAANAFKVIKTYEDDYGEVWEELEGTINIDTTVVADIKSIYKKAKETYTTTCSACHKLVPPSQYTVNQWPQRIVTMLEQVKLDKPVQSLITKYLQHHASDVK